MDDNQFWAFVWKIVGGIVALIVVTAGAYNINADFQKARVLGSSVTPAGVNCAFNSKPDPVVCALLVQQTK